MAIKPCAPKMSCTSRANRARPKICLKFRRKKEVVLLGELSGAFFGDFFGDFIKLVLPVRNQHFRGLQVELRSRCSFRLPIVKQFPASPLRYKRASMARYRKGAAAPTNRRQSRSLVRRCGQDLRQAAQEKF